MKTWIAFGISSERHSELLSQAAQHQLGIIFSIMDTDADVPFHGSVNLSRSGMLPGLMSMSVLFGTTSMLAVTITFERRGRSFERLLLAPISLAVMVAAKLSGAILFGIFNAFVPVVLAAFFVDLAGINWCSAVGSILIAVPPLCGTRDRDFCQRGL